MTKKINKSVKYAICVVMIVFYLIVLYWGKNPAVPTEYRMYYITHELSDWAGYGKLNYDSGTEEICVPGNTETRKMYTHVCSRKGQGWNSTADMGSMTTASESYMYFIPNWSAENGQLNLNIKNYKSKNDIKINVYVNDTLVGEIDSAGMKSFQIHDIKENELMTVRFENNDNSLALWSISIN